MALRSPPSTPRRDLARRDSPPADSPPLTYHGGPSNGAKSHVRRKIEEEVAHLLAKLEKEGLEIDGKIASIIDDGIAKIKAEAVRENNNELKQNWIMVLLTMAFGFIVGAECYGYAFRAANAKEDAPSMRAKSKHA
ncbi:hypothetical protein C2845_PM07G10280 [Panicum miliaceum]|uniref:Uncharacterized protein n=1 Tax=Panicum miliaceum TaxID=4540 RepID=A0A3L6SRX8_PANMI|nr:hypothetical protein C2845_PM07G10280 [Panicum miliaceum]